MQENYDNVISLAEEIAISWPRITAFAESHRRRGLVPEMERSCEEAKRTMDRTTTAVEKENISKRASGVPVCRPTTQFGMAESTIGSILKNKGAVGGADVARGVETLARQRTQTIEEVEKWLTIWINEKLLAGDHISENIICEKALQLHADLTQNTPGTSAESCIFKASRGWLDNFKRRSGIHSVVRHGKAADKENADRFVLEFKDYVKAEGFLPQQVFNCDETGLFWKRMPKRTYIRKEEELWPGHKPMKDRLTLLFCANASGDFKLKPLLVYHSVNPRVFKKNNVMRSKLHVMWRANSKAWVTRQFFIEWVHEVFGPSVKKYLRDKHLPMKCLLLVDNAPAHPPSLEGELVEEFSFISVKFLPPNTTSLIQPMDQQVISNFKKLYNRALFQRCFEVTSDTGLTLREFWKNHFSILHGLHLIDKAWRDVSQRTLKSAWKKLWPEAVPDRVPEDVEEDALIVEDIVSLGKSMGLEVSRDDVEELVEEHKTELTAEELRNVLMEQQQAAAEELFLQEEERRESVPTALIEDMCAKWADLQVFVEKYHPDKAAVSHATSTFNDHAMSHFRQILKRREEEQMSIVKWLARKRSSESEPGVSGVKKIKETQERSNPQ
ncbi:tigger transposable element-derived protein 1-like isoform X3 [Podarcis raffonei]|uniref:tigger transposable element-derived protein 1-like isoform X3 n=1 Tax=Podarcis raffonei TaxID=65483 RepID=UPI0023295EC7|nr:tigger transposable element-derived protein 1-like isoform X3 [Podarcis raffonei]